MGPGPGSGMGPLPISDRLGGGRGKHRLGFGFCLVSILVVGGRGSGRRSIVGGLLRLIGVRKRLLSPVKASVQSHVTIEGLVVLENTPTLGTFHRLHGMFFSWRNSWLCRPIHIRHSGGVQPDRNCLVVGRVWWGEMRVRSHHARTVHLTQRVKMWAWLQSIWRVASAADVGSHSGGRGHLHGVAPRLRPHGSGDGSTRHVIRQGDHGELSRWFIQHGHPNPAHCCSHGCDGGQRV